jgi:rare lipoprotein A
MRALIWVGAMTLAIALAACSSSGSRPGGQGLASYYADRYQGRPTANGETFDVEKMTAAHRTLAFGTRVRVTNLDNGKSVVVRINDRGPFVAGRVIDLSPAAARRIEMTRAGVVPVKLEVLDSGRGEVVSRVE